MADRVSAETFAPYIGKAVSLDDGPTLTLAAVDRHKSATTGNGFTLLLRGAPAPIAPEGMHRGMRFSCGCPPVGASDPIAIVGAAEL
jgi:hypothetical protein